MSETLVRLTSTAAARAILSDSARHGPEAISAAEQVIAALHARRPRTLCTACGSGVWSLHTEGDNEVWACAACHRTPRTIEEWQAEQRAAAEKKQAAPDPAPDLRGALREAIDDLAAARANREKLQGAARTASTAVDAARERVAAAQAARASTAEQSVANRVASMLAGRADTRAAAGSEKTATALVAAEAELAVNEAARTRIQHDLEYISERLAMLEGGVRLAAVRVLAAEAGAELVRRARAAMTDLIAASRGLQSLRSVGAVPMGVEASEVMSAWSREPERWVAPPDLMTPDVAGALARLCQNAAAPVDLA